MDMVDSFRIGRGRSFTGRGQGGLRHWEPVIEPIHEFPRGHIPDPMVRDSLPATLWWVLSCSGTERTYGEESSDAGPPVGNVGGLRLLVLVGNRNNLRMDSW